MSIFPTDEQKALVAKVRQFVKEELPWEVVKHFDEINEFPAEIYRKVVELGLPALTIPKEYGGLGYDQYTATLVMEEIGKGDAGFVVAVGANSLASTPVLLGGNEEQKKRYMRYILDGGLAAFALTEPGAGSDVAGIRTTAVRDGDEYVINGSKMFITNAGVASVYTVFATVDPAAGPKGISAFIVERDRPGVSVGKEENKMGIRLSNTTEIFFDEVRIPVSNRLGEEGTGFKLAMDTLNRTRPCGSAGALGICQSAIDLCVAYGKKCTLAGKPLFAHQAAQFALADMEIRTQAVRALVHESARQIDAGIVDPSFGAVTKVFGSDMAMEIASDAVSLLAEYGCSSDYPVEILMRNAKIYQIFEGTNQIQRMVIAGGLLR